MKIGIISGSHRLEGESGRIAQHLAGEVENQLGAESYILDLAKTSLPVWDEGKWGKEGDFTDWPTVWDPIAAELQACDGFIIISPEYNGMVPSNLKNFFLHATSKEMGHKPGVIVSVSGGQGGSYPIAELRMSSYKNCHLCYIPEHLIIRYAGSMFQDNVPEEQKKNDVYIRERTAFALGVLGEYAIALAGVRKNDKVFNKNYPFGM